MALMLSEMRFFVAEMCVEGQNQYVGEPDHDVDAARIAFCLVYVSVLHITC